MKIGIKLTRSELQRFHTQEVENSIQNRWKSYGSVILGPGTCMKNRVAILAGVVWHQYANLVFSIHLDFKRLHDLLGRI